MAEAIDVRWYLDHGFRVVLWPCIGDAKGPREPGWPNKVYTLDDYREGYRVGLLTGHELQPGKFLIDVDIDWAPGALIAQSLLPPTGFVFGHGAKRISHCLYTVPEPLPSIRYEDIDKTCLLEVRGTKSNGDLGMQTMVPPSIWSKENLREPLTFVRADFPSHYETLKVKNTSLHSAIGMILGKHLGVNGFGHDTRLAFAGYLLRLGFEVETLVAIGEAISIHCNNTEIKDVRLTIESTNGRLTGTGSKSKIKGGPALAKIIGAAGKQVIARINEWVGRDSDFVRDANGLIYPKNLDNVRRAIDLLGHDLSYNEFSDCLMIDGRKMEDRESNSILTRIEIDFHFQPPEQYFERVLKFLAWNNPYHPVKQYLNNLIWDQTPRVDSWLIQSSQAADSEYVRAVSAIMLIAAVRRIREPGCKYDEMMVWESPQGSLKSSAAQALCPNPTWFSDDLPLHLKSQQLIEATLGKWIVESSDLAGKRKTELEALKAMLSRQVDGPARMAYGHFAVERPRQFIFIGTTNSRVYLTDPTGGRRFWPVVVGTFDVQWIIANRDQLWAEACVREAAGESIRLAPALWPAAAVEQEARREIDSWEDPLRTFVQELVPGSDGLRRVSTDMLWGALGIPMERRDRSGSLRISDIMDRLGFRRTRVRVNSTVCVGYIQEDASKLELTVVEDETIREPETPF